MGVASWMPSERLAMASKVWVTEQDPLLVEVVVAKVLKFAVEAGSEVVSLEKLGAPGRQIRVAVVWERLRVRLYGSGNLWFQVKTAP